MKINPKIVLPATAVAALLIGLIAGRLTVSSDAPAETATAGAAAEQPTQWTCSMHPNIIQPEPGDCPICGMDLIPLDQDGGEELGPREMSMTKSAMALAEVQTTEVKRDYPEAQLRLVGSLEYDETKIKSLSARFPARIDELYVNFTGLAVNAGEHLAWVYSPELLTAQRELLTAHRANPDSKATAAARAKLRLWDLLPEQIDEILERDQAADNFELKAPVSGIVISRNVSEGDYVQTGQSLFKIADLSTLWLMLEAYESDLQWIRYGQEVTFTVEAWPGEQFSGTIAFIEPFLDPKTRTVAVRVNVQNPDGRLKPGMFARGIVEARIAENGQVYAPDLSGKWISPMHPEIIKDQPGTCDVCGMDLVPAESLGYVYSDSTEAPLVIPASAVLRTGKRAVVYVRLEDRDQPTFQGREITLGARAGDVFLVKEGLQEGERVVTRGAFKIDSALQIKAKPSMMNPDGGTSSTGHDHDGSASAGDQTGQSIEISTDIASQTLSMYFDLQSALAGDNLDGAKDALRAMMGITGHAGPLPDLIHRMLAADSLDEMRRPEFEILSNAYIEAVKAEPSAFEGSVFRMHCPMVYPDRGADWLQPEDNLLNPYFGAMMLTCGEVKSDLTANDNAHAGHNHE